MIPVFIIMMWMILLVPGFEDSIPPTNDKTFKIETSPDIVKSIEIISDEKMPFWGFNIELKQNSTGSLDLMIPKNFPIPASFTNSWRFDEKPIVLANGTEMGYDIIEDPCFSHYKIPITSQLQVKVVYTVITAGTWKLYSPVKFDENHSCYHKVFLTKSIDSPLKQFKSGLKAEDGSPACVKPQTAQKLVERGWAKSI